MPGTLCAVGHTSVRKIEPIPAPVSVWRWESRQGLDARRGKLRGHREFYEIRQLETAPWRK